MWIHCANRFADLPKNVLCDAKFLVPLDEVPDTYLAHVADRWSCSSAPYVWSDSIASGNIRELDLQPLSSVLKDDAVASPSSRLIELLTGKYIASANYITTLRAKLWDHPRYISSCDVAIVLRWESLSDEAFAKKARDGLPLIANAVKQLPSGRRCAVHVGFEAVNGDAVEEARLQRFRKSMIDFDPNDVGLEYVYAHCLVPESPANKAWLFRETGSWQEIRPTGDRPLKSPLLVLPPGEEEFDGGHWEYRGSWGDG